MPLLCDKNLLTIPEELVACTNLDVTKPIYLYKVRKIVHLSNHYQDCFYFSNKKKQKNCLGKIVLDKNLSFELSENLIGVLKAKKNCVMCAQNRTLILLSEYSSEYDFVSEFKSRYTSRKCQIPNEMLEITKLHLDIPIFLNGTSDSRFFLSNHASKSCLGVIYLDNENFFTLTENMCRCTDKVKDEPISWILDKNKIVLS